MAGSASRRGSGQAKAETRIARWRVKRGLTQEDAATLSGLSLNGYWKYERGRVFNPPIRQLANFAHVFGCQIEDLIEDSWREGYWRFGWPQVEEPSKFWAEAPEQ